MDGIIIVYKRKNMTSHDVVNKMRRIFNTKQIGHLGTLDPNAEGVLVICLNQATKLVQFLESDSKTYQCEIIIGYETDTYDVTGKIVDEKKDFFIDSEKLMNVLKSMIGSYDQVPPIYSSIKINGKKLYEYARKCQTVEIPSRLVTINSLEVISPLYREGHNYHFTIETNVSKGTYIRSLCHDIGAKLGIPCTMGELLRTRSGNFILDNAKTIEEIENGDFKLISMKEALAMYPQLAIDDNPGLIHKIENGMKVSPSLFPQLFTNVIFLKQDKVVAIYQYENTDIPHYKAVRVWK